MKTGLYVHIPFCLQKCLYCDFPSYPLRHMADAYVAGLTREAAQYHGIGDIIVSSVFVGGGTPTCLTSEELERLLAMLHRSFSIELSAEFTVEANPGTVTAEKLHVLKEHGVNRLSFGVQAFQPALLQRLGRLHTREDIYASFALARKQGFANINLDLMSGLPGQTLKQWRDTLAEAIGLNPEHIAAYSLKVEEGTPFYQLHQQGRLQLPDEDTDVAMIQTTKEMLVKAGYQHYEISNYAKPGYQSRHNLRYWHNESYIGVGAAAYSYWQGIRRGNVPDVERYITAVNNGDSTVAERESLDTEQAMLETMMLGLRLIKGVDRSMFTKNFGKDPLLIYKDAIERMVRLDLLEIADRYIRLTEKGLLLGNEVFAEFI
jgi:oxygen-independent coproporphyrinogen III oxidase